MLNHLLRPHSPICVAMRNTEHNSHSRIVGREWPPSKRRSAIPLHWQLAFCSFIRRYVMHIYSMTSYPLNSSCISHSCHAYFYLHCTKIDKSLLAWCVRTVGCPEPVLSQPCPSIVTRFMFEKSNVVSEPTLIRVFFSAEGSSSSWYCRTSWLWEVDPWRARGIKSPSDGPTVVFVCCLRWQFVSVFQLCSVARLMPNAYLDFKTILINDCRREGFLRLARARNLIKIDVNKTRKIYDFLLKHGVISKDFWFPHRWIIRKHGLIASSVNRPAEQWRCNR